MITKARTIRIAVGLAIIVASIAGWQSITKVRMRVIGQPSTTGPIQRQIEEPFFKQLASKADLPLQIVYTPLDKDIARDDSQLAALKGGIYELASLRLLQNVSAEPSLSGIDLPGAATSLQDARRFATRFSAQIDRQLQQNWDSRLLGVWSFGPQVLMCHSPIARLADLKGRRVRVPTDTIGMLVTYLGGTAMEITFMQTLRAMENGSVDCAVSSLTSASAAGWLGKTKHVLNIMLHSGINAYVISNAAWSKLTPEQQTRFGAAIADLDDRIWSKAEAMHNELTQCAQESKNCPHGELTIRNADEADLQLLTFYAQSVGLKNWQDEVGQSCQSCLAAWQEARAATARNAVPPAQTTSGAR
jgi:TRAP-type C4-dicarboxylate transport system substrate-binding protein